MIYVMSDIHGEYDKFIKMLGKIGFCDEDMLYIIGDSVDRGPKPIKVLQYAYEHKNIVHLMGNHEAMALKVLKCLMLNNDVINRKSLYRDVELWMYNRGDVTLEQLEQLTTEECVKLVKFMQSFKLIDEVRVGERAFILVHGGLASFDKDKTLEAYAKGDKSLWERPNFDKGYYCEKNKYVVVGHTPTILTNDCNAKILHCEDIIDIDCGAAYGGKLACLRLDDMQEFYV